MTATTASQPETSNITMQTVVDQISIARPETSYYGPSIGGFADAPAPSSTSTTSNAAAE